MENKSIEYLVSTLLDWSIENIRKFPWRDTKDPYKICVAEMLLQQTSANKVAEVYDVFINKYPNLYKLSRGRISKILDIIRPLGLKYRAANLKIMASQIVKEHDGIFPKNEKDINDLFGIGQYTTSAILCFAYNEQIPILDTNTIRLYNRYWGINRKLPSSSPGKELIEFLHSMEFNGKAVQFNYACLDFGAKICKHYNPACNNCPIAANCKYYVTNIRSN